MSSSLLSGSEKSSGPSSSSYDLCDLGCAFPELVLLSIDGVYDPAASECAGVNNIWEIPLESLGVNFATYRGDLTGADPYCAFWDDRDPATDKFWYNCYRFRALVAFSCFDYEVEPSVFIPCLQITTTITLEVLQNFFQIGYREVGYGNLLCPPPECNGIHNFSGPPGISDDPFTVWNRCEWDLASVAVAW